MFFKLFFLIMFLGYTILLAIILLRRFHSLRTLHNHRVPTTLPVRKPDQIIIQLKDVYKSFGEPVLQNISLKLFQGETLGVLGQSGGGKSVTLKLVAGLLKPDKGNIFFKGQDITSMSEMELLEFRKQVSYVFQHGAMFDFLNVRENIAYPLRERGLKNEVEIRNRVQYLLNAVEMEDMADFQKDQLGSGSKKQLAIARAIANNPEVILYDEPTTGVDPIIKKSLSQLIRRLNTKENLTSIVVTHDLKCMEVVADRIVLLKDGKIRFQGKLQDFFHSTDLYVQAFIAGKLFEEEEQLLST